MDYDSLLTVASRYFAAWNARNWAGCVAEMDEAGKDWLRRRALRDILIAVQLRESAALLCSTDFSMSYSPDDFDALFERHQSSDVQIAGGKYTLSALSQWDNADLLAAYLSNCIHGGRRTLHGGVPLGANAGCAVYSEIVAPSRFEDGLSPNREEHTQESLGVPEAHLLKLRLIDR